MQRVHRSHPGARSACRGDGGWTDGEMSSSNGVAGGMAELAESWFRGNAHEAPAARETKMRKGQALSLVAARESTHACIAI